MTPQGPDFRRPAMASAITDSVSALIIRCSLAPSAEERTLAARSLLALGGTVSARLAFRSGLRKACEESVDMKPLAASLAACSRDCGSAEALFGSCMDCIRSGERGQSEAGALLGSALARRLDDRSALQAVDACLRSLGGPDLHARRGAAKVLLALARHPATDERRLISLALDQGTAEAEDLARKAAALPPKVIDVEAA